MLKVSLSAVVHHCDRLLRLRDFNDWPGAVNGLQAANQGLVRRIAAAVDASLATVELALGAKADLLIVHHGLFWGGLEPWTGRRYELMRRLVKGNLAVYSAHLPLDAHPRLGNNIQLCGALGLRHPRPFCCEKGQYVGWQVRARVPRDELTTRLHRLLGRAPHLIPAGPRTCQRIGIVSGGAGEQLRRAVEEGVDTFVTGEGPHWTYALAEELGLNVFYAGHYATETFGIKALAAHLSSKFHVPWQFLDYPTGL